jgi:hypothetical protein
VTAQLLYEIGDHRYPNPDVVADFSTVELTQEGPDRVRLSGVRGYPAPEELKVSINLIGGFRNQVSFMLTGLDIEAKAALVERGLLDALGDPAQFAAYDSRLIRTDRSDAGANELATAQLRITVKDPDPEKVGRRFSNAATELALASYPGFYLTAPPSAGTAYGVFWPTLVPRSAVEEVVVHPDGRRVTVPAPPTGDPDPADPGPVRAPGGGPLPIGPTQRVPLGTVIGARSGDKGGNANLGLWARSDAGFAWLEGELTVTRLRELLPEAADLEVDRFVFANLRALNFVVRGLLGEGVASSTRPDPQAKSLGEFVRSRIVDLPVALLGDAPVPPT